MLTMTVNSSASTELSPFVVTHILFYKLLSAWVWVEVPQLSRGESRTPELTKVNIHFENSLRVFPPERLKGMDHETGEIWRRV